jgi:pimeloyl-ACP methyl ester carboxylesterase
MKRRKSQTLPATSDVRFPIVIGLVVCAAPNEAGLASLRKVFAEIQARSKAGGLVLTLGKESFVQRVQEIAERADLQLRTLNNDPIGGQAETQFRSAEIELAETADVLLVIHDEEGRQSKDDSLTTYARGTGRPVIELDAQTGTIGGELPPQLEADPGWLPDLFRMAGLSAADNLETIKAKMSELANRTAPLTRSHWNWIVFLQGLAICLPLGWLLGVPVGFVGVAAFLATLLLFILHWWLRGRSMQKTWARARLVAEVARSLIATAAYPAAFCWQSVSTVSSLRWLRWVSRSRPTEQPLAPWIEQYVGNRLVTQQKYFSGKREEAQSQRKKLTSWTTLLLDVALVFAFVGLILVFVPTDNEWMVGGIYAQRMLGSIGVLLLLGLLLIQILRELHELNRRTARFAQQELVIGNAIARLDRIESQDLALEIVRETESKLLEEVLEWYFHAETAERFVQLRESPGRRAPAGLLRPEKAGTRFIRAIPGTAGSAGLVVLHAIVTRLPFIVLSAIAVVVWVCYRLPQHGNDYKALEASVRLLDRDDQPFFNPTADEAKGGIIVLVHGLYGRGFVSGNPAEDERNWMKPCAAQIKTRLHNNSAAICLVDWSTAAVPWQFYNIGVGRNLIGDIPAIRAQAYVVGDVVAFKLAGIIVKNKLNTPGPVPIHLVGHSAGGFVVARVARRLSELGLVPNDPRLRHVTILDTPEPDDQIYQDLPKLWPADFYLTSYGVSSYPYRKVLDLEKKLRGDSPPANEPAFRPVRLDEKVLDGVCDTKPESPGFWGRLSRKTPIVRNFEKFWVAHRAACCWFQRTVERADTEPRGEGFNKSPLLRTLKVAGSQPDSDGSR